MVTSLWGYDTGDYKQMFSLFHLISSSLLCFYSIAIFLGILINAEYMGICTEMSDETQRFKFKQIYG